MLWRIFHILFGWEYVLIGDRHIRRIKKDISGKQYVQHAGDFLYFNSIPDGKFNNSSSYKWTPLTFEIKDPEEYKVQFQDGSEFYVELEGVNYLLRQAVCEFENKQASLEPDECSPKIAAILHFCREQIMTISDAVNNTERWIEPPEVDAKHIKLGGKLGYTGRVRISKGGKDIEIH